MSAVATGGLGAGCCREGRTALDTGSGAWPCGHSGPQSQLAGSPQRAHAHHRRRSPWQALRAGVGVRSARFLASKLDIRPGISGARGCRVRVPSRRLVRMRE
eukprot:12632402-Alexandrium_andersonii.AAC.1